jgi:signal peptidase II
MKINPLLKHYFEISKYSSRFFVKLIILDQLTKWWLINYLKTKPGYIAKPLSILDIVYTWNYGISFGIFRQFYQYSNIFFGIVNSAIIIYLWYLLVECKSIRGFYGYSCIIGGAIGNLIDRIYRGAVFDFIHLHYKSYGFAVFNLADMFISAGVAILIYDYCKTKKSVEENDHTPYDGPESLKNKIIRKINIKFDIKRK